MPAAAAPIIAAAALAANCTPEAFGAVPAVCNSSATDATDAFTEALSACDTVYVGSGTYRIDGTLRLYGRKQLHLSIGATLLRCASNFSGVGPYGPLHSAPVVLLDQLSVLDGRGMVESENPAPRGIVTVGPISTGFKGNGTAKDCSSISNADFATIEGVRTPPASHPPHHPRAHDNLERERYLPRPLHSVVPDPLSKHNQPPALHRARQVSIYGNDVYHDLSQLPPWTPNSTYIQCGMFEGQKAVFGEEGTVGLW